jgi:hypothetical protein
VGILELIALLAVIGFVVWLVTTKVPMPDPYRQIILWGSIVVVGWWLLTMAGLLPDVGGLRVGG